MNLLHTIKKKTSALHQLYLQMPLLFILLLGFLIRIFISIYNYTPIAEDEYTNILEPAILQLKENIPINLIDYRLEVFPVLAYYIMKIFFFLGITENHHLISCFFLFLGSFSVLFIYGMYLLGKNFLDEKWSLSLAWIASLHYILPLYATRPLQSSMSLVPIVFAYYFLTKKNHKNLDFFLSSLFFGISCIVRFQIGILYIWNIFYVIIFYRKTPKKIYHFLLGGVFSIILISILDIFAGKYPASTLILYIQYNFNSNFVTSSYGHQPWFTYILILFLIYIPPISIPLFLPFLRACRKHLFISLQIVLFIFLHSLLDNKLERFLIPILPLFLLVSTIGFSLYLHKTWVTFFYKTFWGINIVLLVVFSISTNQNNIIHPALYMQKQPLPIFLHKVLLYKKVYNTNYSSNKLFFVQEVSQIPPILDHHHIKNKFYLLSMENSKQIFISKKIICDFKKKFKPSLLEQFVIYVNPKMNSRRKTSYLYLCS